MDLAEKYYKLGKDYQYLKPNKKKMIEYYKKSAKLGNQKSSYELCLYYQKTEKYEKINNYIKNLTRSNKQYIYTLLAKNFEILGEKFQNDNNDNERSIKYYMKAIEYHEKILEYGYGYIMNFFNLLHNIIRNNIIGNNIIKKYFEVAYVYLEKSHIISKDHHRHIKKILINDYIYLYQYNTNVKYRRCHNCLRKRLSIKLECNHNICFHCYVSCYKLKQIKCKWCKKISNCKFDE